LQSVCSFGGVRRIIICWNSTSSGTSSSGGRSRPESVVVPIPSHQIVKTELCLHLGLVWISVMLQPTPSTVVYSIPIYVVVIRDAAASTTIPVHWVVIPVPL
jgi:hypothetical protein